MKLCLIKTDTYVDFALDLELELDFDLLRARLDLLDFLLFFRLLLNSNRKQGCVKHENIFFLQYLLK